MQNDELRCGACSRKLAEGQSPHIRIKCPRCGAINHLVTQQRAARPEPERHRASTGMTNDDANPQTAAGDARPKRL